MQRKLKIRHERKTEQSEYERGYEVARQEYEKQIRYLNEKLSRYVNASGLDLQELMSTGETEIQLIIERFENDSFRAIMPGMKLNGTQDNMVFNMTQGSNITFNIPVGVQLA